jgi:hypothetical protein
MAVPLPAKFERLPAGAAITAAQDAAAAREPAPASSAPQVLSYAAPANVAAPRWPPLRIAQLVLGLPALAAPFVTFTFNTSPLECVRSWPRDFEDATLFLIGCSFFAAFPIVGWQVRRLAWRTPPGPGERAALGLVALIATLPAALVVARMLMELGNHLNGSIEIHIGETFLMLASTVAPFAAGVALAVVRARRGRWLAAWETLLVAGFLSNAALCLLSFHSDPELGYWLTVSATASFAIDWLRPRA